MALNGWGMFKDAGREALNGAYREGGMNPDEMMPTVLSVEELAPIPDGEAGAEWRQKSSRDTNAVLRGDFGHLVDLTLSLRYHAETYAEMALQAGISTRHNPMVDAVETLNRGVWPSATWRLYLDGKAQDDPRFDAFVRQGFNAAIKRAAALCWAHPAVCVMPWVATIKRTGERRLVFRTLTPDTFDLKANREAPGEWDKLCVYHPVNNGVQRMTEWSSSEIETYERRVNASGKPSSGWRKIAEMNNPLGIVPAVIFKRQADKLWADHFGDKLREATIEINAAQTLLTYHGPTQVKMLAADFQRGKFQRVRQAMPVDSGPNSAPSVIDLQLDVDAFRTAYIDNELKALAVSMGLPPDEFDRTRIAPASGESIRLRYAERQHRSEEHRAAMLPSAVDLYWVALHVLHHALTAPPLTDAPQEVLPPITGFASVADLPPYKPGVPQRDQPYKVQIDVADLAMPRTQDERAKEQEYNVLHGFSTWAQELGSEQPDLANPGEVIRSNLADTAGLLRMAARPTARPALPVQPSNPLPPKV